MIRSNYEGSQTNNSLNLKYFAQIHFAQIHSLLKKVVLTSSFFASYSRTPYKCVGWNQQAEKIESLIGILDVGYERLVGKFSQKAVIILVR